MLRKLIVTSKGPLARKYLIDFRAVEAAFTPVRAADLTAGIETTVVYMDDVTQMEALGGAAIADPSSEKQTKNAIDSLFRAQDPDFITIFGASDVVVFQHLTNPTSDKDLNIPSDLPYACVAQFSRDINNFLSPQRDVTRLPDMVGGKDCAYPVRVLANVATQRSSTPDIYRQYFAISNSAWAVSTQRSVNNIYRNVDNLKISPPNGPVWSPEDLQKMSFFFNLHGGDQNPNFYNNNHDICFSSADVASGLTANMAISVECCYGAQLYDPELRGKTLGVSSAAMSAGCCAYFGSTNIAYGSDKGQSGADIISQKFLIHLLEGKSIGQAALDARADFELNADMTLPTNKKTLGQFVVYGNGGFKPVQAPRPALMKELRDNGVRIMTKDFKRDNIRRAREIENTIDKSEAAPDHPIPQVVQKTIDEILKSKKFTGHSVTIHKVIHNKAHEDLYAEGGDVHIYTLICVVGERPYGQDTIAYSIVATEEEIKSITEMHSR